MAMSTSIKKTYELNDNNLRLKDTAYCLQLLELVAVENHATISEIFAKRVFPLGQTLPIGVPHLYSKQNPLTIIEHVFMKKDPNLSWKDPENKVFLIGKLKKLIWQDDILKKLFVQYILRINDADYFL